MKRLNTYSLPEEITNFTTHGLGFIMSLAVCVFCIVKGSVADSWIVLFSLILYLIGVCSSYAASTVYHAIPGSRERAKAIARKFDHAAIYWHIAGSYSPLTLIAMRTGAPAWAWVIFGFVWLCAIVGTALSFRKMKAQSYLETTCYVLMGLTILIAFKPFYDTCGLAIVLWVVGEGVAYITGAVLYSFKKVPYIHSVFHLFVILGDVCHMIATWKVIQMFILG
ncbi:MAG: hemolysin III family protein [Bacteroidales bacterium]|nr:hemolysin III family protein [Bacteroidales bacterium]